MHRNTHSDDPEMLNYVEWLLFTPLCRFIEILLKRMIKIGEAFAGFSFVPIVLARQFTHQRTFGVSFWPCLLFSDQCSNCRRNTQHSVHLHIQSTINAAKNRLVPTRLPLSEMEFTVHGFYYLISHHWRSLWVRVKIKKNTRAMCVYYDFYLESYSIFCFGFRALSLLLHSPVC